MLQGLRSELQSTVILMREALNILRVRYLVLALLQCSSNIGCSFWCRQTISFGSKREASSKKGILDEFIHWPPKES